MLDEGNKLIPIEIKSSETFTPKFFDELVYWKHEVVKSPDMQSFVIYSREQEQTRQQGEVINWKNAGNLLKKI